MKMTTGYDFQGYTITEYYDVIFDEMLMGLGFGKSILTILHLPLWERKQRLWWISSTTRR